jgi:hypothetical protein
MNHKIIAVLTDPSVGGTFLSWSLHYLAGHEKYFAAISKTWEPVCSNPLTTDNAHKFKPNQPIDNDSFNFIYNQLVNCNTHDFHTIYFHNFKYTTESYNQNLKESIDQLINASSKIIRLTTNKKHFLYNTKYNSRTIPLPKWCNENETSKSHDEIWQDYINYFFKHDIEHWQKLQLNEIWDLREFLALNIRPEKYLTITPNINLNYSHYSIDSFELYNTFDSTLINDLFNFLEIPINLDKKMHWESVYQSWRKIHMQSMLFVWYFDEIIDSVINGYKMDLQRFNLDIIQEAAIQHSLIYNHNLNLKTWQLKKFISTDQLHQLLEPNTHLIN